MATKPEDVLEGTAPPVEKQPEATHVASTPQDPVTEKAPAEATPAVPTEALQNLDLSENKTDDATAAVTSAPVPAPTTLSEDTKPSSTSPKWPETPAEHSLTKFFNDFEGLTNEAAHDEVYGITLSRTNEFHTKLILQKFLRANQGDLDKAKQQLLETLQWRKEFDPVKAASETFEKSRFEGLGWILQVEGVPESDNKSDVVTFNVYGAVKDNKKTFGDIEAFLRWRQVSQV